MANKDQDGCGALAVVAVIAFVVGRCSVGDAPPRENASDSGTPAALYSEGSAAGADAALDEAASVDAISETAAEPAPPPVRFVSPPRRVAGRSFRNCSEARAAGAAPVMAGDPGYAPRLDRDGDGVGCE